MLRCRRPPREFPLLFLVDCLAKCDILDVLTACCIHSTCWDELSQQWAMPTRRSAVASRVGIPIKFAHVALTDRPFYWLFYRSFDWIAIPKQNEIIFRGPRDEACILEIAWEGGTDEWWPWKWVWHDSPNCILAVLCVANLFGKRFFQKFLTI